MELSEVERTRLLYESRQKLEMDMRSREYGARLEGREEGRKEGLKRYSYVLAEKLLLEGWSEEKVIGFTGLSREEFETLRA